MRIPRWLTAGACALVLCLPVHAATPAAGAPPVPLLWKVSDADNALYLLGSFHMLRPSDYPLAAEVQAAFDDAESVVFEIAPEEMDSPALGMQMGQAAMRADGTRLDAALPEATRQKLAAWTTAHADALQRTGVPPQALQLFEPWFVGLMVSIVDMSGRGLDPRLGLDHHFAEAARQAGKATAGLETGAEQIAFLDAMDPKEQLQFLDDALAQAGKDDIDQLHAAWRRGDAQRLWDAMGMEMRETYPQLYRHINVERNDNWLPELRARLDAAGTDDTLVVVGALHLLGPDGVVEKLRKAGYRVERICTACGAGAR
ncbi:MAG TPA: TraB/GumN family protein [Xanthomonadaceae bacterium]|nr:TraB/GumN family protein [Xanthomonadaceae bacterium]